MNKFLRLLLIMILAMSVFISACGEDDDDDNGNTDPPINPENFDFFFSLFGIGEGAKAEYGIVVEAYEGEDITSVTLSIGGIDVPIEDFWGVWMGFAELDPGESYAFELAINSNTYNFNLQLPVYPQIDWPATFDPTQSYDLSWILNPNINSNIQELVGTSWYYDDDLDEYVIVDDKYVFLDPGVRSYTLAANWLSVQEEYDLVLAETNWVISGALLAVASEVSIGSYGQDIRQAESVTHKYLNHLKHTLK